MPETPFLVLMAEDSEHDIRAARRVWEKNQFPNPLVIVKDGAECLDYLLRRGQYTDPKTSPFPGILLLDLNLPKVSGFEILKKIKETAILKRLPVIVMTTSSRKEDIERAYDLGANVFMTKPVGVEKLSDVFTKLNAFWQMIGLPEGIHGSGN